MGIPTNRDWKRVHGFDYENLIYEKKYLENGGVARLMINNPNKLNAFTGGIIRIHV